LILGIDNAGKSTTLERIKFVFGVNSVPIEKITPTIGLNIGRVPVGDVTATFWDLGGQVALRGIWERYYSDCDGIMFVIDATDVERFDEAKGCLHSVMKQTGLLSRGVPMIVMANKQDDTKRAVTVEHLSTALQLDDLIDSVINVLPCSALTNINIDKGTRLLVQAAQQKKRPNSYQIKN